MWIASHYEFGRRRRSVSTFTIATLLLLLAGLIVLAVTVVVPIIHQRSLLPDDVAKKTDFLVLYPEKPWTVDKKTIAFNDEAKVLTLTAINEPTKLTITQQLTPSIFNDVPQYYPALLDKLNQYDNFGTANGTVYLTKPKELGGKTEAVLNYSGTLMFVFPNKEISAKDWRQFFNNLTPIK